MSPSRGPSADYFLRREIDGILYSLDHEFKNGNLPFHDQMRRSSDSLTALVRRKQEEAVKEALDELPGIAPEELTPAVGTDFGLIPRIAGWNRAVSQVN